MKHRDGMKMPRRDALAAMGAIALAAKPGLFAEAAPKSTAKIALQLYTMREPTKADLADTLKKVRAMGWEYVQWSGMPDLPADKIRAALDTAGLKAMACHCGVEAFETDFDNQLKFWKTVGVEAVGPGGMMKECQKSLADWIAGAKRLDAIGAKLREAGLRLTFHNHSGEFEKFDDDPRCKLDILYETASPKNLTAELDLAWIKVAKVDPAAYLRKCKGRCIQVHAKDVLLDKDGKKKKFAPLGQGELDWKAVFAAGAEAGVQWYIYEQDDGDGSPFDWAQVSYEFLSKNVLGK